MSDEPIPVRVVLFEIDARPGVDGVRDRSAAARIAARLEVASYLDVDVDEVVIGAERDGRPTVAGAALSLAHSGDLVAVAIAPEGRWVGVDVEVVRPRLHVERIARRMFEAHELPAWAALDDDARLHAFLQRWTEVEAILKAKGTGVAGGFASAVPTPRGWTCAAIDAGSGFVGAVAIDAAPVDLGFARGRLSGFYKS